MAELTGIPAGLMASDENTRANLLAGLSALKTQGEIAMQPVEMELKRGQAAHQLVLSQLEQENALKAVRAREAAMQIDAISKLMSTQRQAAAAQGQISAQENALKAQGIEPTIANMQPQQSQLDYFQSIVNEGRRQGVDADVLLGMQTKIDQARQHEAGAAHNFAQSKAEEALAIERQAKQLGSRALYGLQGPNEYNQMRMQMLADNIPAARQLPPVYGPEAQAILKLWAATGLSQVDQAKVDTERANAISNARRADAANSNASTAAYRANAYVQLANARLGQIGKNDGPNSGSTAELRQKRIEAIQTGIDQKHRAMSPPSNVTSRVVGQQYFFGGHMRTWGVDASGKRGWTN
jgi:hypothetical protein